jgi:dUTP pyrophosphatase
VPSRAHPLDAGIDLRTPRAFHIAPNGGEAVINTGVHVGIPAGFVGFLKSKSGLNVKYGIVGEGVIDAGYTGSIVVKLYNHSSEPLDFEEGQKIIQLVILPVRLGDVEIVSEVPSAGGDRGDSGFGSTGK